MAARRWFGALALLGLLALGAVRGQGPPAAPQSLGAPGAGSATLRQNGPPPAPANLERRVSELEARVRELTGELKGLRRELKPAPAGPGRAEVSLFTLKHTKAVDVAKVLKKLFPDKDGLSLRIASDAASNTVVARGSRPDLEVVEAVISKLEDVAEKGRGKRAEGPARRAKVIDARASSSGEGTNPGNPFLPPEKVTLGKDAIPSSRWNSGDYAPGWVEADLGAPQRLDRITLVCCQDIAGATVHEIWVSDVPIGGERSRLGLLLPGRAPGLPAPAGEDRSKAKLVHTFRGETTQGQKLTFEFGPGTTARYVQVRTTQSPTWVGWESIDLQVR